MDEELERLRLLSLSYCERLMNQLKRNKEEADSFLGGDIYTAYVKATDEAYNKARKTRNKIRNL